MATCAGWVFSLDCLIHSFTSFKRKLIKILEQLREMKTHPFFNPLQRQKPFKWLLWKVQQRATDWAHLHRIYPFALQLHTKDVFPVMALQSDAEAKLERTSVQQRFCDRLCDDQRVQTGLVSDRALLRCAATTCNLHVSACTESNPALQILHRCATPPHFSASAERVRETLTHAGTLLMQTLVPAWGFCGDVKCLWANSWMAGSHNAQGQSWEPCCIFSHWHQHPPCSPLFTTLCGPERCCRAWGGSGQHLSTHLSCFPLCLRLCNFWWMRSGENTSTLSPSRSALMQF